MSACSAFHGCTPARAPQLRLGIQLSVGELAVWQRTTVRLVQSALPDSLISHLESKHCAGITRIITRVVAWSRLTVNSSKLTQPLQNKRSQDKGYPGSHNSQQMSAIEKPNLERTTFFCPRDSKQFFAAIIVLQMYIRAPFDNSFHPLERR